MKLGTTFLANSVPSSHISPNSDQLLLFPSISPKLKSIVNFPDVGLKLERGIFKALLIEMSVDAGIFMFVPT